METNDEISEVMKSSLKQEREVKSDPWTKEEANRLSCDAPSVSALHSGFMNKENDDHQVVKTDDKEKPGKHNGDVNSQNDMNDVNIEKKNTFPTSGSKSKEVSDHSRFLPVNFEGKTVWILLVLLIMFPTLAVSENNFTGAGIQIIVIRKQSESPVRTKHVTEATLGDRCNHTTYELLSPNFFESCPPHDNYQLIARREDFKAAVERDDSLARAVCYSEFNLYMCEKKTNRCVCSDIGVNAARKLIGVNGRCFTGVGGLCTFYDKTSCIAGISCKLPSYQNLMTCGGIATEKPFEEIVADSCKKYKIRDHAEEDYYFYQEIKEIFVDVFELATLLFYDLLFIHICNFLVVMILMLDWL